MIRPPFCLHYVLLSLLVGCSSVPPQSVPLMPAPAQWQTASNGPWPQRAWWQEFQQPEITHLLQLAQDNNPDLQAALARVRQARAGMRGADANLLPNVTLGAAATRSKSKQGDVVHSLSLTPQISYSPDWWGENEAASSRAQAQWQASGYAHQALQLSVQAEVASTYFQLLAAGTRLQRAQQNREIVRNNETLLQAQLVAGKVTDLELAQQRTQLANVAADIPAALQQQQLLRDQLALLVGLPVAQLPAFASTLQGLRMPSLQAGLPAQLLQRRPDIAKAEADLRAAHANIALAQSQLWPSLSLNAQVGLSAPNLAQMLQPGSASYQFGANLLAAVFDGGKRQAQIEFASAQQQELLSNYRKIVLTAWREVEDNLVANAQLAVQEKLQLEALHQAEQALALVQIQYRLGRVALSAVLDAQKTVLAASTAVDNVHLARLVAASNLFLALGGGWCQAGAC